MRSKKRKRTISAEDTIQLAAAIEAFRLRRLLRVRELPAVLGVGHGTIARILSGVPVDRLTEAKIQTSLRREA